MNGLTTNDAIGLLSRFGYLDAAAAVGNVLTRTGLIAAAYALYAKTHGIQGNELELEAAVEQNLVQPRCGLPDTQMLTQAATGNLCRWADDVEVIPVCFVSVPDALPLADWQAIFRDKHAEWADAADIPAIEFTKDVSRALIRVEAANIDGPGNVLADMELPCGRTKQRRMRLDQREPWSKSQRERRISAGQTVLHEQGHAWGLYHGRTGVMAPTLSRDMKPQAADIRALQILYGPPKGTATPRPATEDDKDLVIIVRGQEWFRRALP